MTDEALVAMEGRKDREARMRRTEEVLREFPSAPVTSPSPRPRRTQFETYVK
jgi:hypothetical protein